MTAFSFVHAADLHLDVPFRGLGAELGASFPGSKPLPELLRDATFAALTRLTDLCIAESVDFLLLAGDVYNSIQSSLRARLALRDAFLRLEREGIAVFLAHGNHDPLKQEQDGGAAAIPYPDNVTVFSSKTETVSAYAKGGGEIVALIHGVSHSGPKEGKNLAKRFSRKKATLLEPDFFQIGLLHCALADFSGAHEQYAPCSFADLTASGLDYWALGHVHGQTILDTHGKTVVQLDATPLAAYSGSPQGLHVNESGPHGCLLGRMSGQGRFTLQSVPLAPVQWERLSIAPGEDITDIPTLERLLLRELEALTPRAATRDTQATEDGNATDRQVTGYLPEHILVRLELSGRSLLHAELAAPGALPDLREHLNAMLAGSGVWLRDLRSRLRPALDLETALDRQDLAGECLRTALALRQDSTALLEAADTTLEPLFKRTALRRNVEKPDAEELAALAEEAAWLCLELLGPDDDAPTLKDEEL